MSKNKIPNISESNQKLQQAIDLLKFVLPLNDEELIKSVVESVIEILEEEVNCQ